MDVPLYFLNVEVYKKNLWTFYNADTFSAGLKSVSVLTKEIEKSCQGNVCYIWHEMPGNE